MTVFNGYLTGAAEKGFLRKTRKTVFVGYCVVLPFLLLMVFAMGSSLLHDPAFVYTMIPFLILMPLLVFIPKGKKEHMEMLPQKIYTEDEYIICVADRYTDTKRVSDVTKVIDHGEFYELCFPFGKLSDKFICQKSLLTKGTLAEFEILFKGKIVRRH